MKTLIIIIILWVTVISQKSLAQEFTISKVEITSESVILHYNLIDTTRNRAYTINVYTSKDNFIAPLQKVTGDVGLEVKPGTNRRIVWNSKEELGSSFNGDVELEVRGRLYIPFIRFNDFSDGLVMKRGKVKTITWTGGSRQNILNFAIYKGENYLDVIPNVANSGTYDMVLPTSLKPGKGYFFVVSDSKNRDQVVKTSSFVVKRKVPLLLKIIPVALVAALIPSLSGGGSDSADLDTPPDPPPTK